MITNPQILEAFEREVQRSENLTFAQKLALLESMYELARRFGHFRSDRILDRIDHKIRVARAINTVD